MEIQPQNCFNCNKSQINTEKKTYLKDSNLNATGLLFDNEELYGVIWDRVHREISPIIHQCQTGHQCLWGLITDLWTISPVWCKWKQLLNMTGLRFVVVWFPDIDRSLHYWNRQLGSHTIVSHNGFKSPDQTNQKQTFKAFIMVRPILCSIWKQIYYWVLHITGITDYKHHVDHTNNTGQSWGKTAIVNRTVEFQKRLSAFNLQNHTNFTYYAIPINQTNNQDQTNSTP
jgi:hypothetical protein